MDLMKTSGCTSRMWICVKECGNVNLEISILQKYNN